ncbi:hypothetical protein CK203_039065 [Vitis vinifera]|uniref:BED-type domain-containing protein n=1 Tax=Vitis vinifera TaxID=29760 RepID=A0A438IFS6_VITVI|nr:hypothetical protein CK203_039065 [Vitis vinifera]
MASEGGSAVPGRDPAWKYCLQIEGNRNGTICNFCGLVMKSGGITRFKSHLMHKDLHNNTKKCPRVPLEVKEEIRLLVHDKQKAKAKKNVDIEEIRSQLRGTMGTDHTHLVNEDDDDEDAEDEDVYMYPTDMHPDERDAYRSVVRASKASNWEREQHENIVGSNTNRESLLLSSAAKQKNIKDIFKGGAIKETMGRLISKFFIYESVAPAKAKSHHFKNMIIGAQQAGMGIEPPSPYEIKNKYLEMEYKEMEAYVNQQREKWKTYGCSHNAIVYELMHVMKENLIRQGTGDWMFKIIQDRWQKTLKHPLHAAAYFLNPRFQYRRGVGSDLELLQAVHDVFAKLDPTTEIACIYMIIKFVAAEWWFMYENQTPTLRNLAIKVLSQTASSSACERNWSTFALIHTKQRNRLAYPRLEQLVFCYYNMRLKLRDMEAENDRVAEKDYLDLLDISAEVGEEEDNQLFQWVRPIHLDDEVGNPDPRIAAHAREFGVNVERVLSEEVHSESFSKDTNDSLHATYSHQEIDSTSAGHSSRPSAAGTSASGYDGSRGGTDDEGDNGGGDIDERRHSQYPISQFTCENDFTHCTQDEDHGSRRAGPGIGAIGRPYRGRERMMEPYNEELLSGSFESMSIGTQFSDSSNEANVYPPHVMSYGQPSSSTDEEYGMSHYSPSRKMPYQIPYQMEEGFGVNTWVNFEYPINVEAVGRTQEIYAWHVRIYNQYYRGSLTWYQYCLQQQAGVPSSINPIEPHRNSFWY